MDRDLSAIQNTKELIAQAGHPITSRKEDSGHLTSSDCG